jgi:hypothetical protein
VQKPYSYWAPDLIKVTEHQMLVRIIRDGKATEKGLGSDTAWTDEDVEVEIIKPGKLASPHQNARWRQWWRRKGITEFT